MDQRNAIGQKDEYGFVPSKTVIPKNFFLPSHFSANMSEASATEILEKGVKTQQLKLPPISVHSRQLAVKRSTDRSLTLKFANELRPTSVVMVPTVIDATPLMFEVTEFIRLTSLDSWRPTSVSRETELG